VAIEEVSIANTTTAASQSTDTKTVDVEAKVVPEGQTTDQVEGEEKEKPETKPEKTPEERERLRMQRGIDRRTRQLAEARAEAQQLREQLTQGKKTADNSSAADDSEPLSLTRAELKELVKAEAAKLAPTVHSEALEVERRQSVVQSLAKTWGQEKFDEVSSDLDDAFGGLIDGSGKPKPAIEAVFEADEPARVIEYLADPDNLEEAERISKMSAVQAGKAIAKLETKLSTEKPKPKTEVSKAAAPLEPVRGQGAVTAAPSPSDTKAWIAWRNEQERKGL
jgi:hypothetical protein